MDDHVRRLGLVAGVGALVGVGIGIGLGLRLIAAGALAGIGAGVAIGVASETKPRLSDDDLMVDRAAAYALH